ncbi:SH (U2) putative protein [Matariya virus]|uniref:Small hydrophobic protein n=1 Tax=Matariya virus TaxID=1272948 RepID=A0AAE9BMV8_9RHAB|nr:SH (U2) putative protein [Matariya virus]UAU42907.1 SH (U2) putative protein [Matariya virus]WAD86866.1 hypothetical protein [Matariya virus]
MIALFLLIILLILIIRPRYVEWILFYMLGHYNVGMTALYNVNFLFWYLFCDIPSRFMHNAFGDMIEKYYQE